MYRPIRRTILGIHAETIHSNRLPDLRSHGRWDGIPVSADGIHPRAGQLVAKARFVDGQIQALYWLRDDGNRDLVDLRPTPA